MGVKNYVLAVPLTSFNVATINGAFQPINVGGLPFPCFALHITNASNVDVIISYNGTTDNEFLGAGKDIYLNFQTNSQPQNKVALFREGTVVFVRGAAAGIGSINLAGYYQPQGN